MANVNQINFDYNGKHYCLEYTPLISEGTTAEICLLPISSIRC